MALSQKVRSMMRKVLAQKSRGDELCDVLDAATTGVAALHTEATAATTAIAVLRARHAANLISGSTMVATTTLLRVKLASCIARLKTGGIMSVA